MSQQTRKTDEKSDKKRRSNIEPFVETEVTDDFETKDCSTPQAQTTRLSDPRVPVIQRRALAGQIGEVQGNAHLRQLIIATEKKKFNKQSNNNINQIQRQTRQNNPPRPANARETIARAIALYMASATSATPIGRRVLRKLIELNSEAEIGYDKLHAGRRFFTQAEARGGMNGWGRVDIAVDNHYMRDVVQTSVLLVHEAVHHLKKIPYVNEELHARGLQIDYYTELQQGISFGNFLYKLQAGVYPDLEAQRKFKARGQLVDFVIRMPGYRESVDAAWVVNHINYWGSIANRWRYTKARYLQVLSEESMENIGLILDILESETNIGGFNILMTWVGLGNFDEGVNIMRKAIRRSFALYATTYHIRIQRLQNQFNVSFREQ